VKKDAIFSWGLYPLKVALNLIKSGYQCENGMADKWYLNP